MLAFASEQLCSSLHGSSIQCVIRQPHQTATCSCARDFSLIQFYSVQPAVDSAGAFVFSKELTMARPQEFGHQFFQPPDGLQIETKTVSVASAAATGPRNCPRAPTTTVKSAGAITNRDFRTKPFHCDCLIGSFAKVGVRAIGRVVAEIQSLVLDSTPVSEAGIDICSQNTPASFFSVAKLLYSLSNRPTTWHHCGTCLLLGVPQFRRMPKLSRHQTKAARRAAR